MDYVTGNGNISCEQYIHLEQSVSPPKTTKMNIHKKWPRSMYVFDDVYQTETLVSLKLGYLSSYESAFVEYLKYSSPNK
jgi:hypothetical protein